MVFNRRVFGVVLAIALVLAAFPAADVRAANVSVIKAFHATCSSFSVNLELSGQTNDLNGFDYIRYEVTDGTGRVLYQENSARQTGAVVPASVFGLSYNADGKADGAPQANPIRFSVIDLNQFGQPVKTIAQTSFTSSCLAPVSNADYLRSLLPQGHKGFMKAESALYTTPNGTPLDLRVEQGREFTAIYRSNDNAWVALYVGGENLVWVPAGSFDIRMDALNILPSSIDRSQQVTGAIVPGAPVGSVTARFTVRLRGAPTTRSQTLGRVPFGATVAVYGRSANSGWILVNYNGLVGWTASQFYRFNDVALRDLPIVG